MDNFDRILAIVVGSEGGYTDQPADPGNWTGGHVGAGECRGTKFGISAAAYPACDIANLGLDDARSIYRRDYWEKISGDRLPPDLGLLVFDAAVNNGAGRAIRWLQQALCVAQDGVIGSQTLQAVDQAADHADQRELVCVEFLVQRMMFMTGLPTWRNFGLGWARRLCRLPFEAVTLRP